MELKIGKYLITTPIKQILETLRTELGNGLLKSITEKHSNVIITCPFHKGGNENKPSCYVYNYSNNPKVERGTVHCFTCDYTARLPKFIGDCFGENISYGERWLISHFGDTIEENIEILPPITLEEKKPTNPINENYLSQFDYYHEYMWKRRLTKDVVDKFRVGYDKDHDAITFPVWDDKNNLTMVTERSVNTKHFYIDENKEKPVYLLNFIKNESIEEFYIVESQINALTLWSWGKPAVGLIGKGSPHQRELINRSGARNIHLAFDGDDAGRKAIYKWLTSLKNDILVDVVILPEGKDVNDLVKEEFESLPILDKWEWLKRYN